MQEEGDFPTFFRTVRIWGKHTRIVGRNGGKTFRDQLIDTMETHGCSLQQITPVHDQTASSITFLDKKHFYRFYNPLASTISRTSFLFNSNIIRVEES